MEKFFPHLPSKREVHARVRCRAEDRTLRTIKAELGKLNHSDLRRLSKDRDSFVQRQRRSLGHMHVVRDDVFPLSKQYPAKQISPVSQISIFKRQAQLQESFRALEKTLGDKVVRRLERKYSEDFLERVGNNFFDGEVSNKDEDDIRNGHTESTDDIHIISAKQKLEPLTVKLIERRKRNISGLVRGSRIKKEDRKETVPSAVNFLTERSRRAHETVKLPPLSCGSIEIVRYSSPIVPRKPSEFRALREYVSHRRIFVQHAVGSSVQHPAKEATSESKVSPSESAACKGPVRRQTVDAKPPCLWKSLLGGLTASEKEREEMAKSKKMGVIRVLCQRQRQLDNDVQRRVQNFLESHRK